MVGYADGIAARGPAYNANGEPCSVEGEREPCSVEGERYTAGGAVAVPIPSLTEKSNHNNNHNNNRNVNSSSMHLASRSKFGQYANALTPLRQQLTLFQFKIGLTEIKGTFTPKPGVPVEVPLPLKARGVDQYKWDNVYKHVDDALRANPFYSCPLLELVYFCCPGLCFQFAICMLNPINWLCIFCPANQAFREMELKIREELAPLGIYYEGNCSGKIASFYYTPSPGESMSQAMSVAYMPRTEPVMSQDTLSRDEDAV